MTLAAVATSSPPAPCRFPDGDYFGIAVSSAGVTYAIWGKVDGSSLYCCGDTWYAQGS